MGSADLYDLGSYAEALGFGREPVTETKRTRRPKSAAGKTQADRAPLIKNWAELETRAQACQACRLARSRTNVVLGAGHREAQLMFVGEGPGEQEDLKGLPFVGRSGDLLTKMIEAMGLSRDQVYIANVVKCRPPENRNPQDDEIAACSVFLRSQVSLVRPKVLVALGTFAAQVLLKSDVPISQLRGRFHEWPEEPGTPELKAVVMPTYHPAYCLRNPAMKKPVWEDLKLVMTKLKEAT